MKVLKKHDWLVINENLEEMSPKEYYKEKFKKIVEEIKINESKKKID